MALRKASERLTAHTESTKQVGRLKRAPVGTFSALGRATWRYKAQGLDATERSDSMREPGSTAAFAEAGDIGSGRACKESRS